MRAFFKSRAGWVAAVTYLLLAGILFHQAMTCAGWVCDLVALPAAFPLGFPVAWVTDWIDGWFSIPGYTPSFHFRNWYFILPTVILNTAFYYWLGKGAAGLTQRLFQRFTGQH